MKHNTTTEEKCKYCSKKHPEWFACRQYVDSVAHTPDSISDRLKTLYNSTPAFNDTDTIKQLLDFVIAEKALSRAEGREEEHFHCSVGCPRYQSGHSINADGSCNLGCC